MESLHHIGVERSVEELLPLHPLSALEASLDVAREDAGEVPSLRTILQEQCRDLQRAEDEILAPSGLSQKHG